MPILEILIFPDTRLRTVAKTVSVFNEEIDLLSQNMLQTMYQGEGIGLAGTQVNVHKRIIVIDISKQMDLKIQAVKAYESQFYNPTSQESETIISSEEFLDSVSYRAKDLGRQSSCKYAEGFIAHQLPKADSLLDI